MDRFIQDSIRQLQLQTNSRMNELEYRVIALEGELEGAITKLRRQQDYWHYLGEGCLLLAYYGFIFMIGMWVLH